MYCRKWDSKKKLCYYKAKTRMLETDKAKNIESDTLLLLKLEDLKEQVKFLENGELLLREQLDKFKSSKIQLFKKGQYSNSTRVCENWSQGSGLMAAYVFWVQVAQL